MNKAAVIIFALVLQTLCIAMELKPNVYGQVYVPSMCNLSCCYEYTAGPEKKAIELRIPNSTYHKMAYMCTAIKILNGYFLGIGNISGADLDVEKCSYTPESTRVFGDVRNVLVPYLGFIKKKDGTELEYITNPWIKDGKCVVLISGSSTQELSEIYNHFLNDSKMSFGEVVILNNPQGRSTHGSLGHTEERLLDYLSASNFDSAEAVTVDIFSWLDICTSCSGQIHRFSHAKPILFRAISQRKKEDLTLCDSEGDAPIFQELYTKKISLVTRIDPNIDRIRDLVIENLQTGIIRFALNRNIAFWKQTCVLGFIQKTSQYSNILSIFELRFPIDGLLIRANEIFRSAKSNSKSLDYTDEKVDKTQLQEQYDKIKTVEVQPNSTCELFLCFFHQQTGYGKTGTANEWVKVLRGNAALRLAKLECDTHARSSYIQEYITRCLIYTVESVDWNPLNEHSIDAYCEGKISGKSVSHFHSQYNEPGNVEGQNMEMLRDLISSPESESSHEAEVEDIASKLGKL